MQSAAKREKKPYAPPKAREMSYEQAKGFICEKLDCTERDADDFLQSLDNEVEKDIEAA